MSEHVPVAIGIDVGGSGIKGAAVDLTTGRLASNRHRILTPQPATPQACLQVIARIVKAIVRDVPDAAAAPIGIGVPSVVIDGVTKTAANIDPAWVGFDAEEGLRRILGRPVRMVNDADAAGLAEMRFGAGLGKTGTVIVLTLGTGLGSGFFVDGRLVPNTELGHMEIRGRDAERRSAAAARVRRGISWKAWAEDLDEHLNAIHRLFWPSLLILGGGVSKNADKFVPRLTVPTTIVAATLRNEAGIVGAALFAAESAGAEGLAIPDIEPGAGSEAAAAEAAAEAAAAEETEATEETETAEDAEAAEEAEPSELQAGREPGSVDASVVGNEAAGEAASRAVGVAAEPPEGTDEDRAVTVPAPAEGFGAPAGGVEDVAGRDQAVAIEPSVTVAPAWAADAPEGDAQGYPVAPATMASSGSHEAIEAAATEGEARETAADGAETDLAEAAAAGTAADAEEAVRPLDVAEAREEAGDADTLPEADEPTDLAGSAGADAAVEGEASADPDSAVEAQAPADADGPLEAEAPAAADEPLEADASGDTPGSTRASEA